MFSFEKLLLPCCSLQSFRIYRIAGRLSAEHTHNFFRRPGLQIDEGLFGLESRMGRQNQVVSAQQGSIGKGLLFHHIESRAAELPLVEGLRQGSLVH